MTDRFRTAARSVRAAPIALAVSWIALLACGGGGSGAAPAAQTPQPAVGIARIVATGAFTDAVARVAVELAAQGGGGVTFRRDMTLAGGRYEAEVTDVPVGPFTVRATALAADGITALLRGEATASIAASQVTAVSLLLEQVDPPPSVTNAAPSITGVVASDAAPYLGETITLVVTATDPDAGDTLTYAWEVTCAAGAAATLSAPTSATTELATACVGALTVMVQVSDQLGATATRSLVLEYTPQGIAAILSLNSWPDILSIASPEAQVAAGGDVPLVATAGDDDGDPLAYEWASACGGAFTGGDTAAPTFHAPSDAPADGACQLTLTVSDGRGGTTSGDLVVWVE